MTENGALVDLSLHLGGWVSIIGYIFSLLALATSFWANTLNLRDIVNEQTGWGVKKAGWPLPFPVLLSRVIRRGELCGLYQAGRCGAGADGNRYYHCL